MKKFQFRLESLLTYRKYLERVAQQETAKAHMDVKKCRELIKQLENDYNDQSDRIEKILETGMSASEFRYFHDYLSLVETQIGDENKRKAQLKQILKQKVKQLQKKSIDKKAMELYRERKQTDYHQALVKLEQKELDEISLLKNIRTTPK